jgi:hypothetical protein
VCLQALFFPHVAEEFLKRGRKQSCPNGKPHPKLPEKINISKSKSYSFLHDCTGVSLPKLQAGSDDSVITSTY